MMLTFALLAVSAGTAPSPPPPVARASTMAFVRVIRAAAIREGRSDEPHRRTFIRDEQGRSRLLLEFE